MNKREKFAVSIYNFFHKIKMFFEKREDLLYTIDSIFTNICVTVLLLIIAGTCAFGAIMLFGLVKGLIYFGSACVILALIIATAKIYNAGKKIVEVHS